MESHDLFWELLILLCKSSLAVWNFRCPLFIIQTLMVFYSFCTYGMWSILISTMRSIGLHIWLKHTKCNICFSRHRQNFLQLGIPENYMQLQLIRVYQKIWDIWQAEWQYWLLLFSLNVQNINWHYSVHPVQTGIQTGNLLNLMSYYTQVKEQIHTNFPYPLN